jgi:2-methylcitrate dehydratase PrpD
MTISEKFARFITEASLKDMPEGSIDFTRRAMIDTTGVALAGSLEPAGKISTTYVEKLCSKPVAGVIGGRIRAASPLAALANGIRAHALDYDDNSGDPQSKGSCHTSSVLISTVLALAEELGASGKEIVEAHVVGAEVWSKLSGVISPSTLLLYGWHPTAVGGTIGATAAAAKLLKLDVEQTQYALGIACSEAGGLTRNFGSMAKPFHAGNAANNGVTAAMLAKEGFTSVKDVMESDIGYFAAFYRGQDFDLSWVTEKLGTFDVVPQGLKVKLHPSCSCTHRSIDAAVHLATTYDIKPDEVEAIECLVPPFYRNVSLPYANANNRLEGKFCLPFVVAAAIKNKRVGMGQVTDEEVNDPVIQDLISKTDHRDYPDWTHGDVWEAVPDVVTVKLKDGRKFSHEVMYAKGWPQAPLTDEELLEKYRDCAGLVLGDREMEQSVKLMMSLGELKNINELMDILSMAPSPAVKS